MKNRALQSTGRSIPFLPKRIVVIVACSVSLVLLPFFAVSAQEGPQVRAPVEVAPTRPGDQGPRHPAMEGLFDPRHDLWSVGALQETFEVARTEHLPSRFLGEAAVMVKAASAALPTRIWFANDFDVTAYDTITVAPPVNGIGRGPLVLEDLLYQETISRLNQVKGWKDRVSAGTDGQLQVFLNIRVRYSNLVTMGQVTECLMVDERDRIMARIAVRGRHTDVAVQGSPLVEISRTVALLQMGDLDYWDATKKMQKGSASSFPGAMAQVVHSGHKGKLPRFTHGPAEPLPRERAWYTGPAVPTAGPRMQQQIEDTLALLADSKTDLQLRRESAIALGWMGVTEAIPILAGLVEGRLVAPDKLRDDAIWALGEIRDPVALPVVEAATGISKKRKSQAILKLTEK